MTESFVHIIRIMAPVDSTLSQTILSLTQSKIRELENQRDAYKTRKKSIIEASRYSPNVLERAKLILSAVNNLQPHTARDDPKIISIGRYLQQAQYDSSIPVEMLEGFEKHLLARLDARSAKLAVADLYSRLLMDWVDSSLANEKRDTMANSENADAVDEEYEVVEERQKQRLWQLCDQFEAVVFTPLEMNEQAIHSFLGRLFPEDENGTKALENLREGIRTETTGQWKMEEPFDMTTLSNCIRGLLTEDLLSEEKQEVLKSFLNNKLALNEIADVLNFRYAGLESWDWHASDAGIPVLPQQQLNGKYRIWMDEDVLQTIFVQYIGIALCNRVKEVLESFVEASGMWNWSPRPQMTESEKLRRQYYLGSDGTSVNGLNAKRKDDFLSTYLLCRLPATQESLFEEGGSYDNDDDDEDEASPPAHKEQGNIKQKLLRTVAAETLLHRELYGQAAVIQSDLKWYGTGLSHDTIFAVMRFVGFSEDWINFFRKYLESPLNMDQSSEGREQKGTQIRKRGMPMAHASEKLLGELVLFFMDLAVNRETGMLLYRLHDDLWLCGEPAKCARAWEVMHEYAKVTGLEFNEKKTGSVYLANSQDAGILARLPKGPVTFGFLMLDENSGDWVIDQAQVDAHVQQLQTQLNNCDNVIISWIRTWNSCIGRFFKNTFGQPANCFGGQHVDVILATYEKLNKVLFTHPDAPTVTDHLRHMICSRLGPLDIDIPDAFFFLPEEFGGLGLRNPFIPVLLIRDKVQQKPTEFLDDFKKCELRLYHDNQNQFYQLSDQILNSRANSANPPSDSGKLPVVSRSEQRTFMSFHEWSRFRESSSVGLRRCYERLMNVPPPQWIDLPQATDSALELVQEEMDLGPLDNEKKWILQLYSDDLLSKFGGLNIVDKKFLPMGVLTMIREKRVKWQLVL